jgi:hypothetical protein
MEINTLPDPVPLGVSGELTVARADYLRLTGGRPSEAPLLDDPARAAYLSRRITAAMAQPEIPEGSRHLADLVLSRIDADIPALLAEKALATLRDGEPHSATVSAADPPHAAVLFVAFNGSARELQAQRYGTYLPRLLRMADLLRQRGWPPAGLLEIDAYVLDEPDVADPGRSLAEIVEVGIEYTYLPSTMFGPKTNNWIIDFTLLVNRELLTPEQDQALSAAMA